jgi:hypothetical protein
MGGQSGSPDIDDVPGDDGSATVQVDEPPVEEPSPDEPEAQDEPEPEEPASEAPEPEPAPKAPPPALLERPWVLLAIYAALAVAVTWPLAAHITGSMTYGTEPVTTVPLFNLWTLEWNQHQLGDLYRSYWDAPLFHPTSGAFALSEPQPLTGLVFAPIAWLSGNPVLGYNVIALLILMLNGYAGSRLARALGAAAAPAALVGALAVGLSFVAHQMGVLQLTAVFPLLLLIEAVVRWAPGGGRWPAARLGLWLAVTFLTCGYYGLFAVVCIGPVTLVLARRSWLSRERLVDLAVAGAVFAVLALPMALGQANITSEYERSEDTIAGLSAGGREFWQLEDETNGASVVPWLRDLNNGHGLYPGTGLLLLGAAGLLLGSRDPGGSVSRGSSLLDEKRRPLFLFLGVCLAWVLSRGLKLSIAGFKPYDVVRTVVPGFDELRSPFRFAVLAELFLLGLAAYGLDALWHWRWRRLPEGLLRRLAGPVLAGTLVALTVVEVGTMPVDLFEVDQATPEWVEWLEDEDRAVWAANDGPDDRPVLALLPFPPNGRVASYETHVRFMRHVLEADATTVNGYSGLFPDEYHNLDAALRDDPAGRGADLLREYGVDYLVVAASWRGVYPNLDSWLATHPQVFVGTDATVYVFR